MSGLRDLELVLDWHKRARQKARDNPGRKVCMWVLAAPGKPRVFGFDLDCYPIARGNTVPTRVGFYMGSAFYPER
jgi:hypothetical protein